MKNLSLKLAFILVLVFGLSFISVSAQTLLNEIETNSPDSNSACRYAELRGTPGSPLTNLYFLSVNGDSGSFGTSVVVNLTTRSFGSNGFLVITRTAACPNRTFPAETTIVTAAGVPIGGGTESFLLVSSSTTITAGTDVDTNNDGVIDNLPAGATIIDAIGVGDAGVVSGSDVIYGGAAISPLPSGTDAVDALTRFPGNNTPASSAAWYYGELTGTGNSTTYSSIVSGNFPQGGALTPGAANVPSSAPVKSPIDFNGDGKTDFALIRDSGGQKTWYTTINGTNEFRTMSWGSTGDTPVPADYDGDGKTDIAIWRPDEEENHSGFYIFQSSTNTIRISQFGRLGDNPKVIADYDGDGKTDIAVYREGIGSSPQSYFYYRPSSVEGVDFYGMAWGITGDTPAPADYDGDGKADFTVRRDSAGQGVFFIHKSSSPISESEIVHWGLANDIIVPGDYDGDGKDDVCVSRIVNGSISFFILTRTNLMQYYIWGTAGDILAPGDYNGDGKTDFAVWRQETTATEKYFWILLNGQSSDSWFTLSFGSSNDYPVANYMIQ